MITLRAGKEGIMKIKTNEYWSVMGNIPGRMDFGSWVFRIGGEIFWAADCYYKEAEKRAKEKARSRKVKEIYLLP